MENITSLQALGVVLLIATLIVCISMLIFLPITSKLGDIEKAIQALQKNK
jgi:hypothetical protein